MVTALSALLWIVRVEYNGAKRTAARLLLEAAVFRAVTFQYALVDAQSAKVGLHAAKVRRGSARRVGHLVVTVVRLHRRARIG